MTWVKLDDCFTEHRRIQRLSDRAFRLHVTAMCMCSRKLTDGHIDGNELRIMLAAVKGTGKHVAELVASGAWETADDGYLIHHFLDYQLSAEKVKQQRQQTNNRVRNWRSRNAVTNDVGNAAPTRPVPVPEEQEQKPALVLKKLGSFERLMDAITDADGGTLARFLELSLRYSLKDGDFEEAREAAMSKSARSPAAVAYTVLEERGKTRAA